MSRAHKHATQLSRQGDDEAQLKAQGVDLADVTFTTDPVTTTAPDRAPLTAEEIAKIDRKERGIPQAHEMARILDSHESLRRALEDAQRLHAEQLERIARELGNSENRANKTATKLQAAESALAEAQRRTQEVEQELIRVREAWSTDSAGKERERVDLVAREDATRVRNIGLAGEVARLQAERDAAKQGALTVIDQWTAEANENCRLREQVIAPLKARLSALSAGVREVRLSREMIGRFLATLEMYKADDNIAVSVVRHALCEVLAILPSEQRLPADTGTATTPGLSEAINVLRRTLTRIVDYRGAHRPNCDCPTCNLVGDGYGLLDQIGTARFQVNYSPADAPPTGACTCTIHESCLVCRKAETHRREAQ